MNVLIILGDQIFDLPIATIFTDINESELSIVRKINTLKAELNDLESLD